ncbi:MAG: RNA pseudouridine synthase [Elusimicrobia bacterium]|nr:RNA pseudouridine synthase [Elusimicrobiota bacterium]
MKPDAVRDIIIYEDNHLLALNKPAGMLTQPNQSGKDSLEDLAKEWIKVNMNKPGNVFLHPVHRIDREVSGVVLFARTGKALSRLNEEMRNRDIVKIYHAVTCPGPSGKSGTLEHYLRHSSFRAAVAKNGAGKKAVLEYRKIKDIGGCSLLEICLKTGRYHQIRVQLSEAGWPVLGDTKYGGQRAEKDGIFLHHYRMEIIHPVKKEKLVIRAGYPDGWKQFLK